MYGHKTGASRKDNASQPTPEAQWEKERFLVYMNLTSTDALITNVSNRYLPIYSHCVATLLAQKKLRIWLGRGKSICLF